VTVLRPSQSRYGWRRVDARRWWAPDHGSAYLIKGEWWAMNSSSPEVPLAPVVGPFLSVSEAVEAYDLAMEARR